MATAMVWGAAGGIGGAIADRLAKDGWSVVGVARDADAVSASVAQVIQADLADPFAVHQAALLAGQSADDEFELWVYAAGDILSVKAVDLDPEAWNRVLGANLSGAFLATHYSMPYLREDAHLVYLGAVSERLQLPGLAAYAASKSGLEALAAVVGKEERRKRITVVRPGAVDTSLWEKVPMKLPNGAMTAAEVADRIVAAHHEGARGTIDL